MGGHWAITISKAVHEEEARAIVQDCYSTDRHGGKTFSTKHPYFTTTPVYNVDSVVIRAFTYGWDFPSDFDRQSYENRGRTFRMVKKSR